MVGQPSDLLAAAAFAALVLAAAPALRTTAATRRIQRTAAPARTQLLATSVVVTVLLAQVLHAHLHALARQRASGHRAALALAVALLLALVATLLRPHRRLLRTPAAGTLAALPALPALPAIGAPIAFVVAIPVVQLLAALLQALAHRFEALFGPLQAFSLFGARGRLAVRALRLLAFLGGGEREEQTEHEHQTFHGDHLRGVWKAAGNAPRVATPTCARSANLSRLRLRLPRADLAPVPMGSGCPHSQPVRVEVPALLWDFSGCRPRRRRPAARRSRCAAR